MIPSFRSCPSALLWTVALAAAAAASQAEPPLIIVPNAEGILDLASAEQMENPDPLPNPFRIRWHPARPVREVPIAIAGLLVGTRPNEVAVCINGRPYGQGDRFEGLAIAKIAADEIQLRLDRFQLWVPVQDQPLTLRLSASVHP